MTKPTVLSLRRIWNALWYSIAGFKACFIHEQAFRQEIYAAVPLLPLGLWLGQDGTERALLVGSLLLVLIVELLNSAIEALVDRVGTEHHELSGRTKDIASAAVFLTISLAVLVWVLILVPRSG